tara:strand:+ start:114 stop:1199 length:1086 start_codon:yes stop_codon:yes gene_type:complete
MPITPTFDPTTGASGGASGGGGSEPGLTVTGRTDGEAYNVSAGARSLSISNPDGATLSTTVEQASTGGAITVTGSTGTTPSWTAPSGSTTGEAVQVRVQATKGGLSTSVGFTERVAGSGGGSWTDLLDLDFTTVSTASALSVGSHTIAVSGKSVAMDWSLYSGADGTVTPTAGTGMVYDGGTDTSSTCTLSIDIDPLLASYTVEDVRSYQYAVHVVITGLTYPSSNNSMIFVGLNQGSNISHNSGRARMLFVEDAGDGANEEIRVRKNTSASAVQATTAIKTSRVVTLILTAGEIVQVMDTSGTTPPTPAPGGAATITVGSESVGLASSAPTYQSAGLRCFASAGDIADFTLTRILVQRLQ